MDMRVNRDSGDARDCAQIARCLGSTGGCGEVGIYYVFSPQHTSSAIDPHIYENNQTNNLATAYPYIKFTSNRF